MSKRSFAVTTFTPTGVADAADIADSTFMAIGAVAAANALKVQEIYIGGQAAASSVNIMLFARHSTLVGTPTALAAGASDGPLHTSTTATQAQLGSVTSTIAGAAQPQRATATTSAKLNLTLNAFGGIVRWVAAPDEEWGIVGVTASISESSLSGFTGSAGAIGAHIIYEPL